MFLRDNSARTKHEPESRLGAAVEPPRCRVTVSSGTVDDMRERDLFVVLQAFVAIERSIAEDTAGAHSVKDFIPFQGLSRTKHGQPTVMGVSLSVHRVRAGVYSAGLNISSSTVDFVHLRSKWMPAITRNFGILNILGLGKKMIRGDSLC